MFYFKRIFAFIILIVFLFLGFLISTVLIRPWKKDDNFIYLNYIKPFIDNTNDKINDIDEIIDEISSKFPNYYFVETENSFSIELNYVVEKPILYSYYFNLNYINNSSPDSTVNNWNFLDLGYSGVNLEIINNTGENLIIDAKAKLFHFYDLLPITDFQINLPIFNSFEEFEEWEQKTWKPILPEPITINSGETKIISPDGTIDTFFYFNEQINLDNEKELSFVNDFNDPNNTKFNLLDGSFWKFNVQTPDGENKILSMFAEDGKKIFKNNFYRYEGSYYGDGTPLNKDNLILMDESQSNINQFLVLPTRGTDFISSIFDFLKTKIIDELNKSIEFLIELIYDIDVISQNSTEWTLFVVIGLVLTLIIWFIIIIYYYIVVTYNKSKIKK